MSADIYADEGYFAVIPEWILDAPISAQAVRLYAVLRRYADQRTMHAHPSRKTLAERMHVKDPKTVDRATAELVDLGAVAVFSRWRGEDGSVTRVKDADHPEQTSNGYTLLRAGGGKNGGPPCGKNGGGGGTSATRGSGIRATRGAPQKGDELEPLELEPVEPEKTIARSARSPRGSRLPDGFDVTPDMAAWARENAPNAGPRDHEEFCDHWRGQPGQRGCKADWVATWRNWMRRASDKRPTTTGSSRPARGSHTDKAMRIMEMAAAMDLGSAREIGA